MAETAPNFEIVETTAFLRWVRKNRLGKAVEALKAEIAADPETGDVIPGYGRLRKIRMGGLGRGKRGGFRVVYVLVLSRTAAILLDGYSKSEKEDLSDDELKSLAGLVSDLEAAVSAARIQQPETES